MRIWWSVTAMVGLLAGTSAGLAPAAPQNRAAAQDWSGWRELPGNGLTEDEIKELLMQTAIYCGVPDANTAFRIASAVLAEP